MVAKSGNYKWLQQQDEDILEPELPIIDPTTIFGIKMITITCARYLLDEILEDIDCGHNIVATVFIECGAMFKKKEQSTFAPLEKQNL